MGRLAVTLDMATARLGLSQCVSVTESRRPTPLLVLRYVAFLLALGVIFWGIEVTPFFYFAQLTHWGALLVTGYFAVALASYSGYSLRPIAYVLYEVGLPLQLLVTVTFWTLMYPFVNIKSGLAYSIAVHGGLLVLMLADYVLNHIRFIRSHCWALMGLMGAYVVVSAGVTLILHPIYATLTYKDLSSYLSMALLMLLAWGAFRLCEWTDGYKLRETEAELGTVLQDF